MYDRYLEAARAAGEENCDPDTKCFGCEKRLIGTNCDWCRDNPDPDPDFEVARLIHWLEISIKTIGNTELRRTDYELHLDSPDLQSETKQAVSDFIDDGERLVTLLDRRNKEKS